MNVPEQFKARMQRLLGEEYGQFIAVYGNPAVRGVRVNTLKAEAGDLLSAVPFSTDGAVPWCGEGFYTSEEKPGLYIEHAAGLYYVQEPSAMCAVPLFSDLAGKAVLDLCAAPGGKSTQLAARMRGSGILFCNEINFSRAKALSQNIERMGVKNACVTVAPPGRLSEIYPACFDSVLVDAPCSGEGMFRKEEGAAAERSRRRDVRVQAGGDSRKRRYAAQGGRRTGVFHLHVRTRRGRASDRALPCTSFRLYSRNHAQTHAAPRARRGALCGAAEKVRRRQL